MFAYVAFIVFYFLTFLTLCYTRYRLLHELMLLVQSDVSTMTLLGPLMPDLSDSSHTVVSPPKMTTKLRCVFQGGEPPIRVSMSRHKVKIAHAQGRTLSFVIKPHIYDDGHFVCRATDARNKTVTHKINLHVPGKTS